MNIRKQTLIAAALLIAGPGVSAAQTADPLITELSAEKTEHYKTLGQRAAGFFFDGQVDSVLSMLSPTIVFEMGGAAGLEEQMGQTQDQLGLPVEVLVERVGLRDGKVEFWWEANFSNVVDTPFVLRLQFDKYDLVAFGDLTPKSAAPPLPEL
jgi:hypothetical protein